MAAPRANPSPYSCIQRTGFRAVFVEHEMLVRRTLRRFGVRPADLEDLEQEVFLVLFRRLCDYDTTRPLRPWLRGIARRVAVAHRRLARERVEVLGDEGAVLGAKDAAPLPDRVMELQQDHSLVTTALGALDRDRRAVLELHDLQGTAIPEIARMLAIPLETAYSRLRLARLDLGAAAHRLLRRRR